MINTFARGISDVRRINEQLGNDGARQHINYFVDTGFPTYLDSAMGKAERRLFDKAVADARAQGHGEADVLTAAFAHVTGRIQHLMNREVQHALARLGDG